VFRRQQLAVIFPFDAVNIAHQSKMDDSRSTRAAEILGATKPDFRCNFMQNFLLGNFTK
jgi:hypothetical protein